MKMTLEIKTISKTIPKNENDTKEENGHKNEDDPKWKWPQIKVTPKNKVDTKNEDAPKKVLKMKTTSNRRQPQKEFKMGLKDSKEHNTIAWGENHSPWTSWGLVRITLQEDGKMQCHKLV